VRLPLPRASIFGLAAGLGIAAIAVGAYFLGAASAPKQVDAAASQVQAEAHLAVPGPMYVWKERVVNLADQGGRRYLKVALSIEFKSGAEDYRKASAEDRKAKSEELEKELAPQAAMMDDAVIGLLSARTAAEISTPEGKANLKNDIREKLNKTLGGDHVVNVFFTQFVIQ